MTADVRWLWRFGAIAAAAVWGPHGAAAPASARRPIVVAELITSEGCSSCPPADMLLSRLVHQPPSDVEVLTVAEHVDYVYQGRRFGHVILASRGSTVSLMVTPADQGASARTIRIGDIAMSEEPVSDDEPERQHQEGRSAARDPFIVRSSFR